jgi:hypothetical protein
MRAFAIERMPQCAAAAGPVRAYGLVEAMQNVPGSSDFGGLSIHFAPKSFKARARRCGQDHPV